MSSTTHSTDTGDEPVERRVEEAVSGRFVRDVVVNPSKRIATVLMGRQYAPETAEEIVQDEVESILPDEWIVNGILAPAADVDLGPPFQTCGLRVIPLEQQSIDDIDIHRNTVGIVSGGLDAYLASNRIASHDIPQTYGRWDDEFPSRVELDDAVVFGGPVGEARDADEALQFCFKSEYVQAGVRILTGGGRFNQNEFTFHEAVPLAILEHPTASIAIAPMLSNPSIDDVRNPEFVYSSESGGDFQVLE